MRIQQKVASYKKICQLNSGLIGQANGSKVVHLSADPNAGPFKGRFPLKFLEARKLLGNPSYFEIVGFTNTKLFLVMTVYFINIFSTLFYLETQAKQKTKKHLLLI